MPRSSLFDPIRLAAVEATQLLDTPPEESFDRYTRLAKQILGTDLAIVSLVLGERQFYKSCIGMSELFSAEQSSPIDVSLCKVGVERGTSVIIRDGPNDPFFREFIAVKDLHLHSYVGVPLFDESLNALGTLCVANYEPRNWSDEDIENLETLALAVANEILLHKSEQARKAAQESARREHDLLDLILDTSIAAITLLDTEGNILSCNQAAQRVLGLTISDVEKLTYNAPEWHTTDVDGGPWPDENSPFRRVLATGNAVHDIRHAIEWPDGRRRILSVSGAPLRDDNGHIFQIVFLVNDITEQHTVTKSLTRIAEQFRKSFCMSSNWVMLCDYRNRKIVEISDGLMNSMHITRGDCVGQRLDEIGVHFALSKIDDLFSVTTAEPQSGLIELRLQATNESLRLIEVRSQLIEVGSELLLSISGHDITEQRAEKQRRASLERQLREAQKAEIAGQLAGGLAHDFNNILTAIIGNSEIAGLHLSPQHPAKKPIGLIKKAGQRAAEQIRQILALSRKEQTTASRLNIGKVITETTSLFRSQCPASVTVEVEPFPEKIYVLGNSAQIDQILTNLLANARHAISNNGKISVRLIDFQDADADDLGASDAVVIEVEDSGMGIDPVHLPLVFEPFFTTKETGAGTGIGLALARTIARSFDGDLTVDSQPGAGATFRLLLPRDSTATGNSTSTNPPFPLPDSLFKLHILMVDDNPDVLMTSCMIMEQLGHKVESTQDPQAALESLSSRPENYDLLVTDNLMPELTGLELIDQLRQRGVKTPAILISGFGTPRKQIEKLTANRAHFLPKPFSIAELSAAISHTIKL